MFDSFFRRGREQRLAAEEKYYNLTTQVESAIMDLIIDKTPLSEKGARRIQEFTARRDNIGLVWANKGPSSLQEIVAMLEELLRDVTRFDPSKYSL